MGDKITQYLDGGMLNLYLSRLNTNLLVDITDSEPLAFWRD